jgi:predicted TIM-barrel fold metal-dependent hydrolase
MQDPALAPKVLDHAIGGLDLCGVSLLTTVDEKRPLVTEVSLRVFARIAELGVPLVLHPGFPVCHPLRHPHHPRGRRPVLDIPDLADGAAAGRRGRARRRPGPRRRAPAFGGVLPYVAERIGSLPGSKARHRIEHCFETNFYVDTAARNPGPLQLAIEAYGIDRIIFATHYPFYDMSSVRQQVEDTVEPQASQRIYANRVPGLRLPTAAPRA